MKILILCSLFVTMAIFSHAQDPWNSTKAYCEIVGTSNFTGTKVKVQIDFGQSKKLMTMYNQNYMVDADGKKIQFNSMVDAMNYLAQYGWNFEQAYVVSDPISKNHVYHFLLSKEINSTDDITRGINTKGNYDADKKENDNIEIEEEVEETAKKNKKILRSSQDDMYTY